MCIIRRRRGERECMALDFSCKVSFVSHGTADPRFLDNLMGTRNQKENVESKMLFCPPDDSGPTHKRKKKRRRSIRVERERRDLVLVHLETHTHRTSRALSSSSVSHIRNTLLIFLLYSDARSRNNPTVKRYRIHPFLLGINAAAAKLNLLKN